MQRVFATGWSFVAFIFPVIVGLCTVFYDVFALD